MRLLVLATRLRDAALNACGRRIAGPEALAADPVASGGAIPVRARPESSRFDTRAAVRRASGLGAALESDSEIERRCRWSVDFL